MIERAEEDGSVVFQDGCRIKADAILHCTGYKYSFPFLGEDAAVAVEDNRVGPLYKHVFPPAFSSALLHRPAHPTRGAPFARFHLQSKWVAGVLSGRIELPPEEEMTRDVTAFYSEMEARGLPARHTHDVGWTFEYEDWVAERCRCGYGEEEITRIEEWRKEMHVATVHKAASGAEGFRDEWDDDHLSQLLARASQDFAKYT